MELGSQFVVVCVVWGGFGMWRCLFDGEICLVVIR